MKRYEFGNRISEITADGRYVLFTDAQADKHAALKELALEVFPALRDVVDAGKYGALRSKLYALIAGLV